MKLQYVIAHGIAIKFHVVTIPIQSEEDLKLVHDKPYKEWKDVQDKVVKRCSNNL